MKKGLSVLLIAAALFGFYGGATNLNDVLACKDYFESASGASDDMQRLEDGLNQLKDNEQAYLDGQVALAEGEKTLADGKAQYAEGLAAYKAAPKQLADGEKSLKDLAKLIKGLKTAQKHGTTIAKADKYWHDAYTNALKPGRAEIISLLGTKAPMIGMLVGDNSMGKYINNEASYPNFDKDVQKVIKAIPKASETLKGYAAMASQYADNQDLKTAASALQMTDDQYKAYVTSQVVSNLNASDAAKGALAQATGGLVTEYSEAVVKRIADEKDPLHGLYNASDAIKGAVDKYTNAQTYGLAGVRATVASQVKGSPLYQMKDMLSSLASSFPDVADLVSAMDALVANTVPDNYYSQYITGFQDGLGELATTLNGLAGMLDSGLPKLKQWDEGYQTLAHAKDGKTSKKYPDDLASKKSGVPFAFKNMVTNKTIKAAIKKYDPSLMKVLKKYTGNRLKNDSMDAFDKDIVYLGDKVIPRALKVLAKVKADGEKTLAEGYKSYKEAPAKLADAEKQLADGEKQLADGKAQLAQYEDGEQQVRDGLATLVGTQAMGDVQGIADRIGNDTDFDNGDNHLELDEGLSAVQAGKGYASDLTAAVTSEIMSRAIATGLLIGAGVLAVLAALLSFLKKNKGAGVFAILAAAAGVVGAIMGNNAGLEFSSIAGSTMGAAPWVAAGILAAVAAVHSIVHFTAKKEA